MAILAYWDSHHKLIYVNLRTQALFWSIICLIMWIIYGWDSTIQQTVGGPSFYGYGHHWSTALSFAFMLYLSFVNLGVGGIRSLGQLKREMKRDLVTIRHYLNFKKEKQLKLAYPESVVSTHYLFAYSILVVVGIFFIFESIWVLLYDFGNFGSPWWPVYYTLGPPGLNYVTWRNFGFAIGGLILGFAALSYPSIRLKGEAVAKYAFKMRSFDKTFWGIAAIMFAFSFWFYYPIPHEVVTWDDLPNHIIVSNVESAKKDPMTNNPADYIFPTQTKFPQTSYTFYEARHYLQSFSLKDIRGFYIDDPMIHAVNVVCKSLTLGVLMFPALVFVRRNGEVEGEEKEHPELLSGLTNPVSVRCGVGI